MANLHAPFIVYNNGTSTIVVDCGQGFRIVLPPGSSVEAVRTGWGLHIGRPQQPQGEAPDTGLDRPLPPRRYPRGTPAYAAEKARLDTELDAYWRGRPM